MPEIPIASDTIVRRRTALLEAELDGDLLGMHVDTGVCYGFNPTASAIWQRLESPVTFAALVEQLVAEFDVSSAQCATETAAVLRDLHNDGLVCVEAPTSN